MAEWVSELYPNEVVYGDRRHGMGAVQEIYDGHPEFHNHVARSNTNGVPHCLPRNYSDRPTGYHATVPTTDIKLIPKDEWIDRLKEQEKNKSRNSDIILSRKIPYLEQNGLGFCWNYCVANGVTFTRAASNLPFKLLSGTMGGAIVNGYKNEGGFSLEACKFAAENGICEQSFWPEHELNRKFDTPAMRANAKENLSGLEFQDAGDVNTDVIYNRKASAALQNLFTSDGFNWQGHATTGCDLVYFGNGQFGFRNLTSWLNFSFHGFYLLRDSKAYANDSQIIVNVQGK